MVKTERTSEIERERCTVHLLSGSIEKVSEAEGDRIRNNTSGIQDRTGRHIPSSPSRANNGRMSSSHLHSSSSSSSSHAHPASSSTSTSTRQQAYRLKSVRYLGASRWILLQNENGPCPLLAAANALLLRGEATLDPACLRSGVASADDVVNVLADIAAANASSPSPSSPSPSSSHSSPEHEHRLDGALRLLPLLRRGMDVNPAFGRGPTGVERTAGTDALDLLGVELVHGWLLDPQDAETSYVVSSGGTTYNELVEIVVAGAEARGAMAELEGRLRELEERGIMSSGGEDDDDDDDDVGADAGDDGVIAGGGGGGREGPR